MGKSEHMVGAIVVGETMHKAALAAGYPEDGMILDESTVLKPRQSGKTDEIEPECNGIPKRLSMLRSSPYFTSAGAFFGVKLNGVEVHHVIEFSVNAGWIKVGTPGPDGKVTLAAAMNPETRIGKVETFWKMQPSRQVRRQFARML